MSKCKNQGGASKETKRTAWLLGHKRQIQAWRDIVSQVHGSESNKDIEAAIWALQKLGEKMSKPLGIKNYGSIAHLPNSRLGSGDHSCHQGQAKICTVKTRDQHDKIIVQEKLDGSNVGVAKVDGKIYALTRAGYIADTSPYEQHHRFNVWVAENEERFYALLSDGERIVGEWLAQAHGTRYKLYCEPFIAFDIMTGKTRLPYDQFKARVGSTFVTPHVVHIGGAISVQDALNRLGEYGNHGAIDPVEGVMYRVERNDLIEKGKPERAWKVDFLAKYVKHDKTDGKYLESVTGNGVLWNQ